MYQSIRFKRREFIREGIRMFFTFLMFWALYWGFWIAFEKPHYDEQERLFREQLLQVDALQK